jgi:DNA-directed RNA polymerase subunit M/transcription elongation factor TFIIS
MLPRQKILNKFNSLDNIDQKTAEIIENSIFNYTQNYCSHLSDDNPEILLTYMEKSRSLYENLNSNYKNKIIIDENIADKDIKEFRWKNLWKIIKQNQEILDKNLMDLKPTTETDQFLCKKCNQRKTTFYTMQIRSADESETSFITCLVCNYSWREG